MIERRKGLALHHRVSRKVAVHRFPDSRGALRILCQPLGKLAYILRVAVPLQNAVHPPTNTNPAIFSRHTPTTPDTNPRLQGGKARTFGASIPV